MTVIDSCLYYEFYQDEKGIGIMTVHPGRVEHHNEDEWRKWNKKLVERMELEVAFHRSIWKLPNKPDPIRYRRMFEEQYKGVDLSDPKIREETREEWIRQTLKDIHTRLERFFREFLDLRDSRMYSFLANLTISTYFRDQFEICPLFILNGVQNSGKTTVLNALRLVCYRAFMTSSYTTASLIDLVDKTDATLLLDEGMINIRADVTGNFYGMLLSSYNKDGARKSRMNSDLDLVDVQYHYTNIVLTTRGADMPEDLRSRAFLHTMNPPWSGKDYEDVRYYEDAHLPRNLDPAGIRTDLYALKALTISETGGVPLTGMWLDMFRKQGQRNITTKDESGNYLYGYVHNIVNAPRIRNRTRDLSTVYYTLGLATDTGEEMIRLILDNESSSKERNCESIEAVMFLSLHDLIVERYIDTGGMRSGPISEDDLRHICKDISLKDIREGYASIRVDIEGWRREEVEDSRRLTARFRALRIPYRPGAARINFLDPDEPEFLTSFKAALHNYCPESDRGIYERIMNPQTEPFSRDSNPKE